MTPLPEEGVSETPVTVARNVRMERWAEGKGGVARSVSESVPLLGGGCGSVVVGGLPLQAHKPRISKDESKPNRIRFIVGPGDN